MTRWAWTGPRPPEGGFTPDEEMTVILDVVRTVHSGDAVATGGCIGVDEIVIRTASMLRLVMPISIVTLEPSPSDEHGIMVWRRNRSPLIERSDSVIKVGGDMLKRDRALVDWAHFVRAAPLEPFKYTPENQIVATRGGTNYTARMAQAQNKLIAVLCLRDMARTVAGSRLPTVV